MTSPTDGRPSSGRRALRGALVGALDQAVYSLSSFGLAIVVASSVSRSEFGAFALVFVVYSFALIACESLTCEVYAVLHSDADQRPTAALRAAAGTALVLGAVVGACAGVVAALTDGPTSAVLPAFAIVAPAVFLQDFWRYALFALGRPRATIANDVVWVVVQGALIAAVSVGADPSPAELVAAWGGGSVVAAVLGAFQAKVIPRPEHCVRWLRTHAGLGLRYAAEQLSNSGATLLVVAAIGVTGGLGQVASFRAAQLLYGPIAAPLNGVRLAMTPMVVRAASSRRALSRLIRRITIGLAAVTAVWGGVVLLLPDDIGEDLLGRSWQGTHRLLAPLGVLFAFVAASYGPILGLRALRASSASLNVRLAIAAALAGLGTAGALVDDALGATVGMALAVGLGWLALERAFLQRRRITRE